MTKHAFLIIQCALDIIGTTLDTITITVFLWASYIYYRHDNYPMAILSMIAYAVWCCSISLVKIMRTLRDNQKKES